jgi:hypothetical protein
MGKTSRVKGRSFEQLIANLYRDRWPVATVRRSLQAHKPFEPDVVVQHPTCVLINALWTECQHADAPAPLTKLAQAERDIQRALDNGRRPQHGQYLPIVVWRKTGAAEVRVTSRLWVVDQLVVDVALEAPLLRGLGCDQLVVTASFEEFLRLIKVT